MGFVSFVKKLFGSKTEVTETTPLVEEVQPQESSISTPEITQETTGVLASSPEITTQITDSVTSTTLAPVEDVVEVVKSNKKVVIKKRSYKPKANVTKKSVPSNRKSVK